MMYYELTLEYSQKLILIDEDPDSGERLRTSQFCLAHIS